MSEKGAEAVQHSLWQAAGVEPQMDLRPHRRSGVGQMKLRYWLAGRAPTVMGVVGESSGLRRVLLVSCHRLS